VTQRRGNPADVAEHRQGRGSSAEVAEKHRRVVMMRLDGKTWAQIAAATGYTERNAQLAFAAWRDRDKTALMNEQPIDLIHEHLAGFRKLRADASAVFDEAAGFEIPAKDGSGSVKVGSNPSARVGALRLIADLRQREILLLQQAGMLPRNLGAVHHEVNVRFVIEQMIEVARRHQLGPEVMLELKELLPGGGGDANGDGES
jgi:hypothetical protein